MFSATLTLAAMLAAPITPATYSMRLNLHQGQRFKCKLLIERDKPKSSAEIVTTFTISKVEKNVMYMDCKFTTMKVNGKDRTKELNFVCGNQVTTFPWTIYSRRTGVATYIRKMPGQPDVMAALREGGIYLADFQRQDVKPGDSWDGSTTATGGCTGARYNFKEVKIVGGRQLAYFDVTDIRLLNPDEKQVGSMKMVVDLANGLPTMVDYKVKNSKTGTTSHFRQTRE